MDQVHSPYNYGFGFRQQFTAGEAGDQLGKRLVTIGLSNQPAKGLA
jgi:hypothetical protein